MSWHWSSANKFFCPLDLKAICLGKVTSHRAYKNECSYTWFLRSHQNTSVWLTNLSRRAPVILRSYSSIWQGECWTVLLKSKLMRPWVMHWIFFFSPVRIKGNTTVFWYDCTYEYPQSSISCELPMHQLLHSSRPAGIYPVVKWNLISFLPASFWSVFMEGLCGQLFKESNNNKKKTQKKLHIWRKSGKSSV